MQNQKLSDDTGTKDDRAANKDPTTPKESESAESNSGKKPATRFVDLS